MSDPDATPRRVVSEGEKFLTATAEKAADILVDQDMSGLKKPGGPQKLQELVNGAWQAARLLNLTPTEQRLVKSLLNMLEINARQARLQNATPASKARQRARAQRAREAADPELAERRRAQKRASYHRNRD